MKITTQKTIFNKSESSLLQYFKVYNYIFKVKTYMLASPGHAENTVYRLTRAGWVEQLNSKEIKKDFDNVKIKKKLGKLECKPLPYEYKVKEKAKLLKKYRVIKKAKKYNKELLEEMLEILDY